MKSPMNWTGIALLMFAATAHAGPRVTTNYKVAADTVDAGGQRATSSAYTNDGSLGGIAGISTVASPVETAKAGYLGQLTESGRAATRRHPDHGGRNRHPPAQRCAVAR